MGMIADGDGRHIPVATEGTNYTKYIEKQFALTAHWCGTDARCWELGCDKSYVWEADREPPFGPVDALLSEWSAYRNKPSAIARSRQTEKDRTRTKRNSSRNAFADIVRIINPFKDWTMICDWEPDRIIDAFDQASQFLGSTVLVTKTLHFLIPDLFVILDRKQSYPPLRDELRGERGIALPRRDKIDCVNGAQYAELMSYVRDEVTAFIADQGAVRLKEGTNKKITGVNDFRWLCPRKGKNGQLTPGTLGKVVDNFFPEP